MLKFFILTLTFASTAFSQVMWTQINHTPERRETLEETLKKIKGDFTFQYFAKYLGSSLSPNMQEGATFNRFKTGQDAKGDEQDFRGAHQTFYSFALGYNLTRDVNLNFTHTYQYDENNDVEYEYIGWDGKKYSDTRGAGNTYNNQRINLNIRNIFSNATLYLNTNFYYEIPSTEVAQDNDMQFGAGFLTTVGFYSKVPGLSYGLNFMYERDVYPDDEYYPDWCKQAPYTCEGVIPERRQTSRAGFSPWVGYMLSDQYSFSGSLQFDWDQDGDQIRSTDFNPNMDDIASMSLNYKLNNNLTLSGGVEASITEVSLDRTALFGTLNLRL